MDYLDTVCNGKTAAHSAASVLLKTTDKQQSLISPNTNWLIHLMYARQEYQFCKQLIDHQLAATYDHEYLYFVKGLIARAEGDLHESLKCFQRAIDLSPKNSEYLKEIGKTLFTMGRYRQSLEVFHKAEQTIPRPDQEIYHYIGVLLQKNVRHVDVESKDIKEYFQRAIQCGRQMESYKKLSEIYRKENNFPKAIELLENCLQGAPQNTDTLTEIAILYLRINDPQSALEKLLDVTKIDEDCNKALMALGAILQSRGDIDGSLNKYNRISLAEHEGAELWSNLGLCFFKKKKFIASIACLKKSVWLSPLNFSALFNLGLVLCTAQQYASAFHCLATAINIRPESAECYMLLGTCLRNLNDHDNAYLAFERSVMLPDAIKNPLIYLNYAIYCQEVGKTEVAQMYVENFFQMTQHVPVNGLLIQVAKELLEQLPTQRQVTNKSDDDGATVESGGNAVNQDDPSDGDDGDNVEVERSSVITPMVETNDSPVDGVENDTHIDDSPENPVLGDDEC